MSCFRCFFFIYVPFNVFIFNSYMLLICVQVTQLGNSQMWTEDTSKSDKSQKIVIYLLGTKKDLCGRSNMSFSH